MNSFYGLAAIICGWGIFSFFVGLRLAGFIGRVKDPGEDGERLTNMVDIEPRGQVIHISEYKARRK